MFFLISSQFVDNSTISIYNGYINTNTYLKHEKRDTWKCTPLIFWNKEGCAINALTNLETIT